MLLLKIFSGTMIDSQFNLDSDVNLSISNSYESDIYIEINSDIIKTFNIIVENDNIRFKNVTDLIDNGNNLIVEDFPYQLPIFFKFDDVKIGVGHSQDLNNWLEIKVEDINELMMEESDKLDIILEDKKNNSSIKFYRIINDISHKIKYFIQPIKNKIIYLYKIYTRYFYIGISVAFVFIILIFYLYNSHVNANKILNSEKKYEYNIAGLKKNFTELPTKYMDLSLQSATNGYLICGLVENQEDKAYIKNRFENYKNMLTYNLSTVDFAIEKINLVLKDANIYNIKIQYDKDSQNILVSGIANSGIGKINDAQISLENYLPCISNIDFSNVFDSKQIIQDITTEANQISTILQIKPNLNKGEIIISGYLTAKQLNELNDAITKLKNKYKNAVNFVSQVKDALSALPFKIYTIYTGDPSYIVTEDNNRIYVGGQINGFKLISISANKIVFAGPYNLEIPIDALIDNSDNNSNSSSYNVVKKSTKQKLSFQNELIGEEFQELKLSIESEQKQLKMINNYKKNIKDVNLLNFLSNQSGQLEKDINDKQHELDYYTK
jgi:hypothetical protein